MSEPKAQPASTAYQQNAAQYLQKVVQLFGGYKKRSFEFLQPAPGQHILDAGCGTGEDAIMLASLVGPSGRVTGTDANPALLETARRQAAAHPGLPVSFEAGDIRQLPFADHAFDRTRADRVFQHLEHSDAALVELIRVTKPGGWVCVLDVDWQTLRVDADDQHATDMVVNICRSVAVNPSAGSRLYTMFKRAGLVNVSAYAEAVCIHDWPIAAMIAGLDAAARRAVNVGALSEADATRWLAGMQARHERGEFFASLTGFIVRGQVT